MNRRNRAAVLAVFLCSLGTPLLIDAVRAADENVATDFLIVGANHVVVDAELLERLTGLEAAQASAGGDRVSIVWPEAQLVVWPDAKREELGRPPLRIRLEIVLTVGNSMPVGETTPYPGLITKLDEARGRIVELETGRAWILRMSAQGSAIGSLIHSNSAGKDHLAAHIPFSIFDKTTDELVAENRMMASFDLKNRSAPFIFLTRINPTDHPDLQLQTTDIGRAIEGRTKPLTASITIQTEIYDATGAVSEMWTIRGRNQVTDLFATESLSLYGCDAEGLMELELRSSGFTQFGQAKTPRFTLRLRYAPALIDRHRKMTYLDPLDGQLVFHYNDLVRLIEIGPGNHGHVASKAYLEGDDLNLELGVALREGSAAPVIARLDVTCPADVKVGTRCRELKLATAVDPEGRVLSPRALSELLERQVSLAAFSVVAAPDIPGAEGSGPGCFPLCPTCKPERCSEGIGIC